MPAPFLGTQPNILVIRTDDAPLDWISDQGMPNFMTDWYSQFITFPNGVCNVALCAPSRVAGLCGKTVLRHRVDNNPEGGKLDNRDTFLAAVRKAGYYTGAVGKYLNADADNKSVFKKDDTLGCDERYVYNGDAHYYNYSRYEASSYGAVASVVEYGATDAEYSTDVEKADVLGIIANAGTAGKPFCIYWCPKAAHQDTGGEAIPATRHINAGINLPDIPSFGLNPKEFGNPKWMDNDNWSANDISATKDRHKKALRAMLAFDEALDEILTSLQTAGKLANTVVILTTDNAHAYGEMRQQGKGTNRVDANSMLMLVRPPNGVGGTRTQAVADFDIATTVCALAGARMEVQPDGGNFWYVVQNANYAWRDGVPMFSNRKVEYTGWWSPNGWTSGIGVPKTDTKNTAWGWNDPYNIKNIGPEPGAAWKYQTFARGVQKLNKLAPDEGLERGIIIGRDYYSSVTGQKITPLRGTNQGTFLEDYPGDALKIKNMGATVVRLVGVRWWGDSYEAGVDCYSPNAADDYILPDKLALIIQKCQWLADQGLWISFVFDSDNGAGVRGLGGADSNFFEATGDGPQKLIEFDTMVRRVMRELANIPRILQVEPLAEPLPNGSVAGHAPILRDFYRARIANIRSVDERVSFLIGPRDSYGANFIEEVYLSERTDVAYTVDFLNNKIENEATVAAFAEGFAAFRAAHNVPIFGQQCGRNTSDDEGHGSTTENFGLTAMNGWLSMFNALDIPYTHWQFHQNTDNAGAYALYYKITYPGSGEDNWLPKQQEIDSFTWHMAQTMASLQTAAHAAVTAFSGKLFYVKDDLSNVWQDVLATVPVTAVGQIVKRIDAVIGTGAFTQSTDTLAPTLTTTVNGYALLFDGVDDYMSLDTTYFASGDDTFVSVGARAGTSAANRIMFQTGNATTTNRHPYLAVIATDLVDFSMRGDDNVYRGAQSTTTCDNRAIVASGTHQGSNTKLFVQGVQEGVTETVDVGAATITRTRIGASTTGTNPFNGPIAQVALGKTVTDEQRRDVDRLAAWRVGAPFRGAISNPADQTWSTMRLLGTNAGAQNDFTKTKIYTNLMHQMRAFCPLTDGGGYGYTNVPFKSDGYPQAGESFICVFLTNLTNDDAGVYQVSVQGDLSAGSGIQQAGNGTLGARTYSAGTNKTTCTLTLTAPLSSGDLIALRFNNVPADFGALEVVCPGYSPGGQAYRNQVLSHFGIFKSIRYMDWMNTNGGELGGGNTDVNWAGSIAANNATPMGYRRSLKACFDFSNALGADAHTNIPVSASDSYIDSYVADGLSRLPAGRTWFVEYGNELWNPAFPAYNTSAAAAFAAGEVRAGNAGQTYSIISITRDSGGICTMTLQSNHGKSVGQQIYVQGFGGGINGGLVTLTTGTTGAVLKWNDGGGATTGTFGSEWVSCVFLNPSNSLTAQVTGGYWTPEYPTAYYTKLRYEITRCRRIWTAINAAGATGRAKVLQGAWLYQQFNNYPLLTWINQTYGGTSWLYSLAPALYVEPDDPDTGGVNEITTATSVDDVFTFLEANRVHTRRHALHLGNVLHSWGLEMIGYEGGPHTHLKVNTTIAGYIASAHVDDRMRVLIKNLWQEWRNRGGNVLNHYYGGSNNTFGGMANNTWALVVGALEDGPNQAKYKAHLEMSTASALAQQESGVNFGNIRFIDVLPNGFIAGGPSNSQFIIGAADNIPDVAVGIAVNTAGSYTIALDAGVTAGTCNVKLFVDNVEKTSANLPVVAVGSVLPGEAMTTTMALSAGYHIVKVRLPVATRSGSVGLYRVRVS